MAWLNVEVIRPEPANSPQEEGEVDEAGGDTAGGNDGHFLHDEEEEESGTVKAVMNKNGFYEKVPEDFIIVRMFKETRDTLGKKTRRALPTA